MEAASEHWYRAVESRDNRFDGWIYLGVTSTRVYCRPSCPALNPKRSNMRFYRSSAAAQRAGFRACKRCRPDASPGSPEWNGRADVVARAMRLIGDGVVDREGVAGLAMRLGYSVRQLTRLVSSELGAGPLALARAQRAQTARTLIETTELGFAEVAFAAGFASVRQFNDTVREVFALTPRELRQRRGKPIAAGAGAIALRLPYRAPIELDALMAFFASRAIAGVEEATPGGAYRRTLRLPHGTAVVDLAPGDGCVQCMLRLADVRDLGVAVARCRRLLDLDADPTAVSAVLGADPLLAPLVSARPGLRVPGCVDGTEIAVRAVLGQQISVAAARTHAARLVQRHGEPLTVPDGTLTHVFPTAGALAEADEDVLALPERRKATLRGVCAAQRDGIVDLDAGADRERTRRELLALPGIGPWTVEYVAMRALGDPDAFPAGDLGVLHGLRALGVEADARDAERHSRAWRPFRAYTVLHLWGALEGAGAT
ncbi:MAG TPA: AlkA N-terminal domain-containing protein [Gaiellales bacterium]|nr:AlkA N-terminal domain-containing protein [Gaiellales bacterium]